MAEIQEELQKQLKLTQLLTMIILGLAVLTFILLFWRTYNLSSICVPPPPPPLRPPPKDL